MWMWHLRMQASGDLGSAGGMAGLDHKDTFQYKLFYYSNSLLFALAPQSCSARRELSCVGCCGNTSWKGRSSLKNLNIKGDKEQMNMITLGNRGKERDRTVQYHRTQPQEDFWIFREQKHIWEHMYPVTVTFALTASCLPVSLKGRKT